MPTPTTTKGSCWSVTINNPISTDEENIAIARQKGWKVDGQLEKGENGTPHYQLIVRTGQVRFSAVKHQFPRAHIELARNSQALEEYCSKEETRVASLPIASDKYPSCSKLMYWFGEEFTLFAQDNAGVNDNEYLEIFDNMIHKKIRQGYYVEAMAVNPQIRSSIKNYGRSIAHRERLHRQKTDRQTDEIIISPSIIPNEPQMEETSYEEQTSLAS